MMRLRAGVAIDLGTVNTLVSVRGRGLVVEEPSAIAVDRATGQTVAAGREADVLTGKAPQGVDVIHPLRDGVIADLDAATAMLQAFLRQARLRRCMVVLVDEPVAAAAGAGFGRTGGTGAFVVDVGGGTTEIAVVAGGHLVRAESLRLAGNAMDEAIVAAVKAELGLLIGRNAARRLKMALGLTGGTAEWAEAVGVDAAQGTPRAERIPGELVAAALEPCVVSIVEAVREILLDLPPDLAEDVVLGKICLAGGGALLLGLAGRIETVAGIPVVVADDPLRCVVRGAADIAETGGAAAGGPAGL